MKKIGIVLFALLLLCTSCKGKEEMAEEKYIYYINGNTSGLIEEPWVFDESGDPLTTVSRITEELNGVSALESYQSPFKLGSELTGYVLEDGILTFDFDVYYQEIPATTQILLRASLVKTYCQLEAVDGVAFTMGGNPVVGTRGEVIGILREEDYITVDIAP